jgi:hypothetical protein
MKKIFKYFKDNWKFGWYYNTRIYRGYVNLILIPTVTFTYDSQGNFTFKFEDTIIDSSIEISLDINWLWFNIGGDLTIKTNKPVEEGY